MYAVYTNTFLLFFKLETAKKICISVGGAGGVVAVVVVFL